MDEVGVAIREDRIKELELAERQLHEKIAELEGQALAAEDEAVKLRSQVNDTWAEHVGSRDKRILELERENNGLRKQLATAMAFAREKQDQYDEMCSKGT